MELMDAEQFREAYRRGKSMLEDPRHRRGGLRYLIAVLEHLEVNKDEKGAWWLANHYEKRTVNLIRIPSLAEAMDVSNRLITKQKELRDELVDNHNEDFAGEYDTSSFPVRSRIFREPQGWLCPIDHIAEGL
jgi:hypothetical protein